MANHQGVPMKTRDQLPECPVATTVQLIGSKWKLLILRNLIARPWRFNELKRDLDGISNKVLTESLRSMEEDGIITRTVVSTSPKYVEYSLSEKGLSLIPILQMLSEWGLKHMFPNMVSFPGEVVSEPDKADV